MQIIEALDKVRRAPRWAKTIALLAILGAVLFTPIKTGKPYTGRVVDIQTGQPIPGVVVVGYWTYVVPAPAESITRCLDACETVSDSRGEFAIPRLRGLFYDWIGRFSIFFYKVGYKEEGLYICDDWEGTLRERGFWIAGEAVAQLTPVPADKLLMDGQPPSYGCGRRDQKPLEEYTKEVRRWENAVYKRNR